MWYVYFVHWFIFYAVEKFQFLFKFLSFVENKIKKFFLVIEIQWFDWNIGVISEIKSQMEIIKIYFSFLLRFLIY